MSTLSSLINKIKNSLHSVGGRLDDGTITGHEIGERIRIYDLVCPIRYDILVRVEFIRFLVENDYLSSNDIDVILEAPAAQRYRTWFKEIPFRGRYPEYYDDDTHIREPLYLRIRKTQELWKSMSSKGFDHTQPIKLRSGELVHSINEKTFKTRFYAGDGCHRIACLLVMGREWLEPEEFIVALGKELHPRDNTAILLDKLPISMSDYLSFISRGYCGGCALVSPDEALAYVKVHSTDRLTELKNVFRHDLKHLK
jgi:hypothetical protein